MAVNVLTKTDVGKAVSQLKRGYSMDFVAKKNHVNVLTLRRKINLYEKGWVEKQPFIKEKKEIKELRMSPYVVPGIKQSLMPIISHNAPKEENKDHVIDTILKYRKQTRKQVFHKSSKRVVAYTRYLIVYFLRTYTNTTLVSCGEMFNRDHTTIIHGINLIKNGIEKDEVIKTDVHNIKQII